MDGFEYFLAGTDPTKADTDGDCMADAVEIWIGVTDQNVPASPDPDSDEEGIPDVLEQNYTRVEIEGWRADYNEVHPQSSLGYLTPSTFAEGSPEDRACNLKMKPNNT